ncbi:MAG TPA: tRNA epoxyqueuosine(34) reductase QueG [Blastocatellia bacterium]|nr:tRNA epoxyqueuosine(34) reductase QueG [Blastocatellia bacterium]
MASLQSMGTLVTKIKDAARELGFDVAGIASVEPLESDDAAFREWKDAGFAAGMDYMVRKPELRARPRSLVPSARSLITLAVDYYAEAPMFEHESRFGRVARYAWGLDYHDVVKFRLQVLATRIEEIAARPIHARCFVDAVPLLERAAAARAGLGFFGKNTNLLQPRSGSWFFLSEILVDLELPPDGRELKVSCGTCRRCIDACPTDAFAAPYQLDSLRCISYLTIEHKSAIPRALRAGVGEWIFGCDVCQEVCPFNRFAKETRWPQFLPEAGVGPRLDLSEVLSIASDDAFRQRFRGTPLTRPRRRGLLRNAAVVAANVGATATVPILIERIEHDPEPLIRSHALWALAALDQMHARRLSELALKNDPDETVREEAAAIGEI